MAWVCNGLCVPLQPCCIAVQDEDLAAEAEALAAEAEDDPAMAVEEGVVPEVAALPPVGPEEEDDAALKDILGVKVEDEEIRKED